MNYRRAWVLFVVILSISLQRYELLLLNLPALLWWWHKPHYCRETVPNRVRILTYNIFMRPLVHNNQTDYKNERLELFLRDHVSRFDIMCLQEMFCMFNFRQSTFLNGSYEHAHASGWARYGLWNVHGRLQIPFLDAGLVTVSKFPITKRDRHVYTQGNKIDGWLPKQVQWSLIRLSDNGYLHVFNTHMQSTHSQWNAKFTSDGIRMTQLEEMAQFVKEKMDLFPYPALLCGDFNLDSLHYPLDYQQMMRIWNHYLPDAERGYVVQDLFQEHPVTFGCPGETTLTLDLDVESQMCVDYVFFVGPVNWCSMNVQVERFESKEAPLTQLSDHYGLSVTLEF